MCIVFIILIIFNNVLVISGFSFKHIFDDYPWDDNDDPKHIDNGKFQKNLGMYYEIHRLNTNSYFPFNSIMELTYETNTEYTIYCKKTPNMQDWTLRWQVDMYGIKTDEVTKNISLNVIPSREDDKLKISCIATSPFKEEKMKIVTLRFKDVFDNNDNNFAMTRRFAYEGTDLKAEYGYNCILKFQNSTITKYNSGSNIIFKNIQMNEDSALELCAHILQYKVGMFDLKFMKKIIAVKPMLQPNPIINYTEKTTTVQSNTPFPTKEVVSGVIALIIVIIICIITYKYATREKEPTLLDHTYSEPEVHYTELQINGCDAAHSERNFDAKIIGIVKPRSRKANTPILPPRNKTYTPEYQEIIENTDLHNINLTENTNYVHRNIAQTCDNYAEVIDVAKYNDSQNVTGIDNNLITNDLYIHHNEADHRFTQNIVTENNRSGDNDEYEVTNDMYVHL